MIKMEEDGKITGDGYNTVAINALESLPRVATARVPLLNTVPSEIHLNRYRKSGKSYEDNKSFAVQKLTHGRILDIGAEIHRLSGMVAKKRQEETIVAAENSVWQHAESIRVEALRDLQTKLQAEHEKQRKRQQRENDKAIKEEAVRVETAMRQLSLDQVKQEREEGERRLQAAVQELEEKARPALLEKVEAARQEERAKAAADLEELERAWQKRYDDNFSELEASKLAALESLEARKDWERQEAIQHIKQDERRDAEITLRRLSDNYESRIRVLNRKVQERDDRLRDLESEKREIEYRCRLVAQELFMLRDTFKEYIHQVHASMPGQADYQMPTTDLKQEDFFE